MLLNKMSHYRWKMNIKSYMLNMKAAHLYLGLGGAYCDLSPFKESVYHMW